MAYKFQLGRFSPSGSIVQTSGSVDLKGTTVDSLDVSSGGITNAGSIAGATSIDGTGDLTMGTITMSGFAVDADGDTALKSLKVDDGSTIGSDSQASILTLAANGNLTFHDGAFDFDVASHDGTNGLKLGGTLLAASAAELNNLDGFAEEVYVANADSIVFFDATDSKMKSESGAHFVAAIAGDALAESGGLLNVQVSGAVKVASDKIGISGSIAGNGIIADGGADSISELAIDLSPNKGLEFDSAKLAIALDSDGGLEFNGSNGIRLEAAVAGDGLGHTSGVLSVNVDGSTIETNADTLRVKAGGVGEGQLADEAVTLAKMQHISQNRILGRSSAGNGDVEQVTPAQLMAMFNSDMGADFTIGNQSDNVATFTGGVTVGGNLIVNGTTTTVNSTTVEITGAFVFEGAGGNDAFETTLSAGTPIQDIDVRMPEYSSSAGAHVVKMAVLAQGGSAASYLAASLVTGEEMALLDGDTSRGDTIPATGDGFLHNDNGTMRQTKIDKLAEGMAGAGLSSSGVALSIDINGLTNPLTSVAQGDLFALADADASNEVKKITFSNLEDQIFGNVDGQASIAAGGTLSLNTAAVSGQTEMTAALVGTDQIIINDVGVGIKRADLSLVSTFIGNNINEGLQTFANATHNLSVSDGPIVLGNRASAQTINLDTPANHQGKRVVIKRINSGNITIKPNNVASQTIDGVDQIILDSDFAAVTIVSNGSNYFIV